MAKQIILTRKALAQRIQILEYWFQRTGNKKYSRELDMGFRHTLKMISEFPHMGKKIEGRSERCFIFKNYQIIFEEDNDSIVILQFWDTRQNPEELAL